MSGFDANRVYSVSVHDVPSATSPDSPSETEKLLFEFIQQFRVGGEFVYRYVIPYLFPSIIADRIQRQTSWKHPPETTYTGN